MWLSHDCHVPLTSKRMSGFSLVTTASRSVRGVRERLSVVLKGPAAHSMVKPEQGWTDSTSWEQFSKA